MKKYNKSGYEREFVHYGKPVTYITTGASTDEQKNILEDLDLKNAVDLPILSKRFSFFKIDTDIIMLQRDLQEAFIFTEIPEDLSFEALIADIRGQAHGRQPMQFMSKLYALYLESEEAVWEARSQEEQAKIQCGIVTEDEDDTIRRQAQFVWDTYHYWNEYIERLIAEDDMLKDGFKKKFVEEYKKITYF